MRKATSKPVEATRSGRLWNSVRTAGRSSAAIFVVGAVGCVSSNQIATRTDELTGQEYSYIRYVALEGATDQSVWGSVGVQLEHITYAGGDAVQFVLTWARSGGAPTSACVDDTLETFVDGQLSVFEASTDADAFAVQHAYVGSGVTTAQTWRVFVVPVEDFSAIANGQVVRGRFCGQTFNVPSETLETLRSLIGRSASET